jgi:hypothetical protein
MISPSGFAGFNPDDLGHPGFLLPWSERVQWLT